MENELFKVSKIKKNRFRFHFPGGWIPGGQILKETESYHLKINTNLLMRLFCSRSIRTGLFTALVLQIWFRFHFQIQITNSQTTPGATYIQSRSQISKTRSQFPKVDPSRLKVDPAYRNIFKVDPSALGMFWIGLGDCQEFVWS